MLCSVYLCPFFSVHTIRIILGLPLFTKSKLEQVQHRGLQSGLQFYCSLCHSRKHIKKNQEWKAKWDGQVTWKLVVLHLTPDPEVLWTLQRFPTIGLGAERVDHIYWHNCPHIWDLIHYMPMHRQREGLTSALFKKDNLMNYWVWKQKFRCQSQYPASVELTPWVGKHTCFVFQASKQLSDIK